jgi:hypothetical protein
MVVRWIRTGTERLALIAYDKPVSTMPSVGDAAFSASTALAASSAAALISKRHNLNFVDVALPRFAKNRVHERAYRRRVVAGFRQVERQVCLHDQYPLGSRVRKLHARHRQDALYCGVSRKAIVFRPKPRPCLAAVPGYRVSNDFHFYRIG